MKTILQKLALSFVVAGSAVAANAAGPLVPVPGLGENAGLSALLDASVAYNDNIYLDDSGEKSDTIFTISPGVLFSTGDEGRSTATLRFVENFAFYMDETDNNRALENVDFTFGHGAEGDKLRLSVAAGFHHNQSASSRNTYREARGTMTRSYNYFANALFSYKVGEKTSVRTGFKWNGLTYQNNREYYNDREQYAIPLYLYYAVTEKLNVGLSGEYRYVDLAASGMNRAAGLNPGIQQVWFFGLSAEGRAWEKLSLNGRIGYTSSDYSHRTVDNSDGKDTMGMSISANYRATEKLTTSLSLSRDFELDGTGENITSTGVRLSGVYKIDDFWSANAALSYTNDDYQVRDREDDIYAFDIGVGYAINEYWSAYANYRFAIDDSNTSQYDYTNNIVTVGVSFRY